VARQVQNQNCTIWPRINLSQADFFNSCAHHRDTYLGLLCVTQANRASTALCLSLSSSMLRFLRRYLCRKRNGLGGRWRRTVDWKNSRILGTSVVLVSLCFCFTFKAATRARICTSRTVQVCHWKVIFPAQCFVTGWRWVGNACLDDSPLPRVLLCLRGKAVVERMWTLTLVVRMSRNFWKYTRWTAVAHA